MTILTGLHDLVNVGLEAQTEERRRMVNRVTYRCEAGIAHITMDDGKVNAMSP